MSNSIHDDHELVDHLSDKALAKQLKKILRLLEINRRQGDDSSELEKVYWLLQRERLKRLKGKNY